MLKRASEEALEALINRFPTLFSLQQKIIDSSLLLKKTYRSGAKILICGNGGSAADSLHIVGELMKSFTLPRPLSSTVARQLEQSYPNEAAYYKRYLQETIPAISLVSETSLLTAYSNDAAPELTFAQQVLGYGQPGDILWAISTSGNSANILHAVRIAKAKGLSVISMTGQSGGELKNLSDILLNVPSEITHHVQELHIPIYHVLCQILEIELFGESM